MDRLRQLSSRRLLGLAVMALALGASSCAEPAPQLSEAATWLRDYVRLDTTGAPGNGDAAVQLLAGLLEGAGAEVERLDAGDGYPSLWAYLPPSVPVRAGERAGGGEAEETLLLLHHLDVVDPGAQWQVPPFSGETVDGELWGRGAIDSKSLGVAHLAAFVELARSGTPRRRGVAFMAGADEERGGRLGVERWLDARPDLFATVTTVINEGGINRGHDGRLHWWGVEISQKRPLWLEVEGETPALIAALGRLVERPYRWRITPAAQFTFSRMAPHYNKRWREIFLDLEKFVLPEGPTTMLLPGMETFFLDSIQVNLLEVTAGDRARARIDVRLLPDSDQAELLAEIEALLGPQVEATLLLASPPVAASPWQGRWIELLEQELRSVAPIVPQMVAGTTDSRYFRERGIAAYGFSPFILNGEFTRTVHARNERIPLAEFDRGVERMTRLVAAWVTDPAPAQRTDPGDATAGADSEASEASAVDSIL